MWFAVVVVALAAILSILAPLIWQQFRQPREQPRPAQVEAPPPAQPAASQLILDTVKFVAAHPEPDEQRWGFKTFVPPGHLASFLFVCWTNGVPTIQPGFSTYFKVGPAGGIDLEFSSLACYPVFESQLAHRPEAERRRILGAWNYPEAAEMTNAVRWDVNLGTGFTSSAWMALPPYRGQELKLPQSVHAGRQRAIRLIEFVGPETEGQQGPSGVELRILLQPLPAPPIRTRPNEMDRTGYIAGHGLAGTMDETLAALRSVPLEP